MGRELAEGERRMAQPQLGGVLEGGSQPLQLAGVAKRSRRLELQQSRATLPDEVRMIRVGKPVGIGPKPGDQRALLEGEHGVRGARDREVGLDRLPALRVGGRVAVAVEHAHADSRGGGDAPHERGAGVERGPNLEVR